MLRINNFTLVDRIKFLATIALGWMFFFYDIDTIHIPLPPTNQTQGTFSHKSSGGPEEYNNTITTNKKYTLDTLLKGFETVQGQDYMSVYAGVCELSRYRCDSIHTEFVDDNHKEYYYALLALVTINKLEQHLIISGTLDTSVVLTRNESKKRGYATKDTIVINTTELSDQTFFEVLVHELGHTIDLKVLQGSQKELDKKFTEFGDPSFSLDDPSFPYYALSRESEGIKKNISSINDFCTIYGSKNPFEDFSECFNLYINHHDYFLSLKEKSSILSQKYTLISSWIQQTSTYANKVYEYTNDTSYRYRDSTKLPQKN